MPIATTTGWSSTDSSNLANIQKALGTPSSYSYTNIHDLINNIYTYMKSSSSSAGSGFGSTDSSRLLNIYQSIGYSSSYGTIQANVDHIADAIGTAGSSYKTLIQYGYSNNDLLNQIEKNQDNTYSLLSQYLPKLVPSTSSSSSGIPSVLNTGWYAYSGMSSQTPSAASGSWYDAIFDLLDYRFASVIDAINSSSAGGSGSGSGSSSGSGSGSNTDLSHGWLGWSSSFPGHVPDDSGSSWWYQMIFIQAYIREMLRDIKTVVAPDDDLETMEQEKPNKDAFNSGFLGDGKGSTNKDDIGSASDVSGFIQDNFDSGVSVSKGLEQMQDDSIFAFFTGDTASELEGSVPAGAALGLDDDDGWTHYLEDQLELFKSILGSD